MLPKKLLSEIRKKSNRTFLIATHINPEGDAVGSELALANLLKKLGKRVLILNEDLPPSQYGFLPGLEAIKRAVKGLHYDAAILVDCSDLSRVGKISKWISRDKPLINIDHHISNTKFGDINWVDPRASSASEMIYELFCALNARINKDDALLLYTGIVTDTGSFRYSTTSVSTHRAVSELLKHGLDVYGIFRKLYESMRFETVKAYAEIISTLEISKNGRVAWLKVNNRLIKKDPSLSEETDNIIQFARCIKGVEAALLFKEVREGREVRVNMRSTSGRVDVNKLARIFGGGGHAMASGCTVKGRLRDVVAKVVGEAEKRAA